MERGPASGDAAGPSGRDHAARPPAEWDNWLQASLGQLRRGHLLRTLRPTVWCNSSSEAYIPRADLDAWVAGGEPVVRYYDHEFQRHTPPSPSPSSSPHGAPASSAGARRRAQQVKVNGGGGGGGEELVPLKLFSLNDYLGLASHPTVTAAAAASARTSGMGPRSSALVGGYTHVHRQLEEELAALKGTEDCLLFPTGFAANLAALSCLGLGAPSGFGASSDPSSASSSSASDGGRVAIFSDELNHASIIDGARLASRAGCSLHVYRHNDLAHLEALLAATPPGVRKLVATDSLFSMDGDFADLRGLAALKARHGFLLAVDEAHATLVCGQHGGGAAEALGVAHAVDLHIGTLSKAFGALGGFVATSRDMKALLLNRGRAFVYSTALPLPVVSAASAALHVSRSEWWRRQHVWSLVERLGRGLGVPALSPVVPLVVGPEKETMDLSAALLAEGLHVPAIRPPTVPPGTCRLRVSLSAAHTHDDVDRLVELVRRSGVALQRLAHLEDPAAAMSGQAGTCEGGPALWAALPGAVAAAARQATALPGAKGARARL